MMDDLDRLIKKQMKNPKFREEMEKTELEYQIARAMMKARLEKNMTQTQVAKVAGIDQADVSRVENGVGNPKISTLRRIANSLGMEVRFDLVPMVN